MSGSRYIIQLFILVKPLVSLIPRYLTMTNSIAKNLLGLLSKSYAQRKCNGEDFSVLNQAFRAIAQAPTYITKVDRCHYVGHELRQTHPVAALSLS